MKLYELAEQYARLQELIEEGEDPEALTDTLEAIEGTMESKVDSIHRIVRNLQADIDALKAEEKRLAEKRKALEERKERLKEYVAQQLTAAGISKVKTSIGSVGFRKAPPSVEIVDEEAVRRAYPDFIQIKYTYDKRELLNHFKQTGEAVGFQVIDDKYTIQFR